MVARITSWHGEGRFGLIGTARWSRHVPLHAPHPELQAGGSQEGQRAASELPGQSMPSLTSPNLEPTCLIPKLCLQCVLCLNRYRGVSLWNKGPQWVLKHPQCGNDSSACFPNPGLLLVTLPLPRALLWWMYQEEVPSHLGTPTLPSATPYPRLQSVFITCSI